MHSYTQLYENISQLKCRFPTPVMNIQRNYKLHNV